MLCQNNFTLWDLGMDMEYKRSLGSHLMPRDEFVRFIHDVRIRDGQVKLPTSAERLNAKAVIDRDAVVPMQL